MSNEYLLIVSLINIICTSIILYNIIKDFKNKKGSINIITYVKKPRSIWPFKYKNKFKIGQTLIRKPAKDLEKWEIEEFKKTCSIIRILDVGKKRYKIEHIRKNPYYSYVTITLTGAQGPFDQEDKRVIDQDYELSEESIFNQDLKDLIENE